MKYVNLRTFTEYSLLKGAIKVDDIPDICKERDISCLAITDVNLLSGALHFSEKLSKNGIHPIIGITLDVVVSKGKAIYAPLVLLVKNEDGYKNIMKLSTLYYKGSISVKDIQRLSNGLILLSGGNEGYLAALVRQDLSLAENFCVDMKETFGENFYIEIQRHFEKDGLELEPDFVMLAKKYNIPVVATNNCYYKTPDMHDSHDILMAMHDGKYVVEKNRTKYTEHHYLKTEEEMVSLFTDIPEAIENTVNIAKQCLYYPTSSEPMIPAFSNNDSEELARQAKDGLKARISEYDISDTEKYYKQLDYELSVIDDMGFPGYFLIVSDFIKWAKAQGIPVGPGRGSGAGSIVAWALTITNLDPIKYKLIFERFLNPARVSMPDFDIDFCEERRQEVVDYVIGKYGYDNVAQIITFGSLKPRAVVKDVGKVLQVPFGRMNYITSLIQTSQVQLIDLEKAISKEPILQEIIEEEPVMKSVFEHSLNLEELYKSMGTHAAGVIIADRPIVEICPLAVVREGDFHITQFDMKYGEKAGLVKFDFLGLKTLTVIDRCIKLLREDGINLDIDKIPLDDPEVYELLQNGYTNGVFQLEGGGMTSTLKKLKPNTLEEISALISLYRPGPLQYIPDYIDRKFGRQETVYDDGSMEEVLEETYGIMVYQEQVMEITQKFAGYTMAEADNARRIIGKKLMSEMPKQRGKFVEGAVSMGKDKDVAEKVFDDIEKFAAYSFNRAHSMAYALIGYQTAYLKTKHPKEFMCALMTMDMGNNRKVGEHYHDCISLGIDVTPPSINLSDVEFSISGDNVVFALCAIKGVGRNVAEHIVEKRDFIFKDIEDFAKRVDFKIVNKRSFEALCRAGCFDSFGYNRGTLANSFDKLKKISARHFSKNSVQQSLFSQEQETQEPIEISGEGWNRLEALAEEFKALEFYLTGHPLDKIWSNLKSSGIKASTEIPKQAGRNPGGKIKTSGVIVSYVEQLSKKGNKFAWILLSDPKGLYELIVVGDSLEQYRESLNEGAKVVLDVGVAKDSTEEDYSLFINGVRDIDDFVKEMEKKSEKAVDTPSIASVI